MPGPRPRTDHRTAEDANLTPPTPPAKNHFETRLAAAWPPDRWHDLSVLLAISGGADSVALLRAVVSLKPTGTGRLVVAHFNHQLRGPESDADEAFVVDLARRLGIECHVGRAPAGQLADQSPDGIEAAAREARYRFLEQTAARLGARYVATAHTADDQAETILHRILRGTGVAGLSGMDRARSLPSPPGRGAGGEGALPQYSPSTTLIRPLLSFHRTEVLAYLDDLDQPFRHDATNDDLGLTRNRIRRQLLPELAANFNPGVIDALLRLGTLAGEAQAVIDRLVDDLAARVVTDGPGGGVRLAIAPLSAQPRYLVRELLVSVWRSRGWPLQSMGFEQWELLAAMIAGEGSALSAVPRKQMFPGCILAEVVDGELLLQPYRGGR
jgi:tRNA(Ile)-lysidine synthase